MSVKQTLAEMDVAEPMRPVFVWLDADDFRELATEWAAEKRLASPDEEPWVRAGGGGMAILRLRDPLPTLTEIAVWAESTA